MNKSGIVRKIDDLGRIVLPKELRKSLNINSGDDFEIIINDQSILLKKYSKLESYETNINKILKIFTFYTKYNIFVTINNVLTNDKTDKITNVISSLVSERKIYINDKIEQNIISEKITIEGKLLILPIVYNSDLLGAIIIIAKDNIDNIKIIANIINNLIKNNFN